VERIFQVYREEECPDELRWVKQIRKSYKALLYMERQKYLEPKFSEGIKELQGFLKLRFVSLMDSNEVHLCVDVPRTMRLLQQTQPFHCKATSR